MKEVIVAPSEQKKEFDFKRAGDVVRNGFFAFGKNLLRKSPFLTTPPSFHTRFARVNRLRLRFGGRKAESSALCRFLLGLRFRLSSQTAKASDVASPPNNVEALRPRKEFIFKTQHGFLSVQPCCVRFGPPTSGTQPNRTFGKRKVFPGSASAFSPALRFLFSYKGVCCCFQIFKYFRR